MFARWGGEEFIALLPGMELNEAVDVAEKLRIKAESLIHKSNEVVTISIGVSMLLESDTLESWLKRTDNALYHAKQHGRNRYCISYKETESKFLEIIRWDSTWNSGHLVIDKQHRELLAMCNELMNSILFANINYSILPELVNIIQHIQIHFEYEEDILSQVNYSNILIHRKCHEELLSKAKELIKKSKNGNILPLDVAKFIIDDMLIKHLIQEDTKFFHLISPNS